MGVRTVLFYRHDFVTKNGWKWRLQIKPYEPSSVEYDEELVPEPFDMQVAHLPEGSCRVESIESNFKDVPMGMPEATTLSLKFNIYKLLDQRDPYIPTERDPAFEKLVECLVYAGKVSEDPPLKHDIYNGFVLFSNRGNEDLDYDSPRGWKIEAATLQKANLEREFDFTTPPMTLDIVTVDAFKSVTEMMSFDGSPARERNEFFEDPEYTNVLGIDETYDRVHDYIGRSDSASSDRAVTSIFGGYKVVKAHSMTLKDLFRNALYYTAVNTGLNLWGYGQIRDNVNFSWGNHQIPIDAPPPFFEDSKGFSQIAETFYNPYHNVRFWRTEDETENNMPAEELTKEEIDDIEYLDLVTEFSDTSKVLGGLFAKADPDSVPAKFDNFYNFLQSVAEQTMSKVRIAWVDTDEPEFIDEEETEPNNARPLIDLYWSKALKVKFLPILQDFAEAYPEAIPTEGNIIEGETRKRVLLDIGELEQLSIVLGHENVKGCKVTVKPRIGEFNTSAWESKRIFSFSTDEYNVKELVFDWNPDVPNDKEYVYENTNFGSGVIKERIRRNRLYANKLYELIPSYVAAEYLAGKIPDPIPVWRRLSESAGLRITKDNTYAFSYPTPADYDTNDWDIMDIKEYSYRAIARQRTGYGLTLAEAIGKIYANDRNGKVSGEMPLHADFMPREIGDRIIVGDGEQITAQILGSWVEDTWFILASSKLDVMECKLTLDIFGYHKVEELNA